jgi:hypothetical protein
MTIARAEEIEEEQPQIQFWGTYTPGGEAILIAELIYAGQKYNAKVSLFFSGHVFVHWKIVDGKAFVQTRARSDTSGKLYTIRLVPVH